MSWDPGDYDGITAASEAAEKREREEIWERENEEFEARAMAFRERPLCDNECFRTATHSAACQAGPLEVVNGWLNSQRIAIAYAARESEAA